MILCVCFFFRILILYFHVWCTLVNAENVSLSLRQERRRDFLRIWKLSTLALILWYSALLLFLKTFFYSILCYSRLFDSTFRLYLRRVSHWKKKKENKWKKRKNDPVLSKKNKNSGFGTWNCRHLNLVLTFLRLFRWSTVKPTIMSTTASVSSRQISFIYLS